MKSRVVTPIAEPVASLPCRKAFEGGQTSGLKAVKPITQSLPENGDKPRFEAYPLWQDVPKNNEKPSCDAHRRASGKLTLPESL